MRHLLTACQACNCFGLFHGPKLPIPERSLGPDPPEWSGAQLHVALKKQRAKLDTEAKRAHPQPYSHSAPACPGLLVKPQIASRHKVQHRALYCLPTRCLAGYAQRGLGVAAERAALERVQLICGRVSCQEPPALLPHLRCRGVSLAGRCVLQALQQTACT